MIHHFQFDHFMLIPGALVLNLKFGKRYPIGAYSPSLRKACMSYASNGENTAIFRIKVFSSSDC